MARAGNRRARDEMRGWPGPRPDAETASYGGSTAGQGGARKNTRSRIVHTALSHDDPKPPCSECGSDSLYYCNMNDAYFCAEHVLDHDENE